MKQFNLNVSVLLIGVQASAGSVFLYCYVGSLTNYQFFRYGDISYVSDWYRMPTDLQKCIQLMIADAQQSLEYHGLNVIDMNLTAFTKVIFVEVIS